MRSFICAYIYFFKTRHRRQEAGSSVENLDEYPDDPGVDAVHGDLVLVLVLSPVLLVLPGLVHEGAPLLGLAELFLEGDDVSQLLRRLGILQEAHEGCNEIKRSNYIFIVNGLNGWSDGKRMDCLEMLNGRSESVNV